MTFKVKLTREAEQDLLRLFEFVLERELGRDGDLDLAERALKARADHLLAQEGEE